MDVCREYGFRKAIHVEELYALMPNLSPLAQKEYPPERQAAKKDALLKRLGGDMSEEEFINQIKFDAIMVIADVFCMEMNLQILTDVVLSKDGRLGGP